MSGLDLYLNQGELLWMLAWAAVTGLGLGGFYDLLRALRIFLSPEHRQGSTLLSRTLLFVTDVVMTLAASLALILLCYYTNDGLLRAPAVVGMASGFFVYVRTVGRLTEKAEKALSRLLKRVVRALLSILRRPLGWLCSTLRKLARKAWRRLFGKVMDKRRERRKKRQAEKQNRAPADPPTRQGRTVFSTRGPT